MNIPVNIEQKIGFDSVRHMVADRCSSVGGRQLVEEMAFSSDHSEIVRNLGRVAEMLGIITGDNDFPAGTIHDLSGRLRSIRPEGTYLTAEELVELHVTLATVADIAKYFDSRRDDDGQSSLPLLDEIAVKLYAFPALAATIGRTVDRWGNVRDSASPELADIRRRLAQMNGTVNSVMRRVIATAIKEGYLEADTSASVRDGRLVIPVAPMNKRRIPGIVHDESASGKTVFIEPAEVVEANNRLRELRMEEHREIVRILISVASELRPHIDGLLESYGQLALFDFIRAKAIFARDIEASFPEVAAEPDVEWYHAVHPVLRESLARQRKEVVPLDIILTPKRRILVVSGPNAGGKSVTLKTVAVVQYMLQCGLLPPVYDNSRMGVFDSILLDIGDDQSIEDDLSTYSSHLRHMKQFLTVGTSRSMVLIDEFGAGTEPQIGGAIAQALLAEFNAMGMWGVVTTHFQNLKKFADETEGLVNGSMLYDRREMRPLFVLSIGNPGSSFAIEIARKIGLPENIIAAAGEIVGSDYINLDKYLLDIARDRRYWENKRQQVRLKEKKIDEVLRRYEDEAENLREQRRAIIADARSEARKILEGSNAAVERTIREIKESQAEKQTTLQAREKLESDKKALSAGVESGHPLLDKAPKTKKAKKVVQPTSKKELSPGDYVLLDGTGTPGVIKEIRGKEAVAVFGQLLTTVKLSRLSSTLRKPAAGVKAPVISASTSDSSRERQLNFKQEIDVRGMRTDEALQAVTYFIDDAIQFNASRVRILHGTGNGILRRFIREYLDTVPSVSRYADEDVRFGGAGITVVEL